MSNRKNYNSIVFLTTLSLYLGLVLAGGATPTVFAQAATTRNFDIKSEIVVEDDLDKKPDDEVSLDPKTALEQSDRQFIEQYAETILAMLKKSYLPETDDYEITLKMSGSYEDDEEFQSYFPALRKDFVIGKFDFTLDKEKLFGKFRLKSRSDEDVSSAFYSYVSNLNSMRFDAPDKSVSVILKNTELTFENNQVFIVTRLPRASIDELLAKK